MKRYLTIFFVATVSMLITVGAVNALVDPYGLFRLIDRPGFNHVKPAAGSRGAMAKTYQVVAAKPNGLILGNSRAEVGLDPDHPAWPASAQPVFNAALPDTGIGTATSLQTLQGVLEAAEVNNTNKPKVIVWGLDFMDFLVDSKSVASPRLYKPLRWQQRLRDYAEATLTLGALIDSVQTLASQRNPYSVDLTRAGFNPMRDYIKITADEGYWNVFRQKDIANIKVLSKRPKSIFDASGYTSSQFEDLREVMRLCRLNGIELHLFTYPYHAHLLEIFRMTGHWSAFESWKRAVVMLAEAEAVVSGGSSVPVWDFSSFNDVTTESIPIKGDRKTSLRWYWEAGHFKSELGNQVLERVFKGKLKQPDFGLNLTSLSLELQIVDVAEQGAEYRNTHTQEIEELVNIASKVNGGVQTR